MSKIDRQEKILELIEKNDIETQEELSKRLTELNVKATQATISRDIKELKLIKVMAGGKYKYSVSQNDSQNNFQMRLQRIFKECVRTIDCAKNLVVIKTLPGLGSAAASALDAMKLDDIVGTLAGDDTVFAVMRSDEKASEFCIDTRSLIR